MQLNGNQQVKMIVHENDKTNFRTANCMEYEVK